MQTHINIFGEDANGVHINKINDDYLARYSEKVIQKHRDAVPTDHAEGSIGTEALADGAVATTKIADGAITEDKLSLDVKHIIEKSGWAVTTITLTDDVYSLSNGAGAQGQIIVVKNSTGRSFQYLTVDNYNLTFDRYISIGEIVVCRCTAMSHDGARYETIMTLYVDEKVASNDILDGAVTTDKIEDKAITLEKIADGAIDETVTELSKKVVTSGAVWEECKALSNKINTLADAIETDATDATTDVYVSDSLRATTGTDSIIVYGNIDVYTKDEAGDYDKLMGWNGDTATGSAFYIPIDLEAYSEDTYLYVYYKANGAEHDFVLHEENTLEEYAYFEKGEALVYIGSVEVKVSGSTPHVDTSDIETKEEYVLFDDPNPGNGSITVDSELSDNSENPIQNNVVKAELDKKEYKWIAITTGTGEAYDVTLDPAPTELYNGMIITVIPHTVSTSPDATLNVNGLGAKKIMNRGFKTGEVYSPLKNDFLTANKPVVLVYDGDCWIDIGYTVAHWEDVLDKDAAPKNHAYGRTDYGVASKTLYGHVQLSDEIDSIENATRAHKAATPYAVKRVHDKVIQKANTKELYGTDNLLHTFKSTFTDDDCSLDISDNGVLNVNIDVNSNSRITLDNEVIPIENTTLTIQMSEVLSPNEVFVTMIFDILTHEVRWRVDNDSAEVGLYDTSLIFSPFSVEYDYDGENTLSAEATARANVTKEYQYVKGLINLKTDNKNSLLDAVNENASRMITKKNQWIATTTGTGEAYEVVLDPAPTELYVGMEITIIAHTISTIVNPTLNVNGLGAIEIRHRTPTTGSAILSTKTGWITQDRPLQLMYNGTYWIDMGYSRPQWSDVQLKPTEFTPTAHSDTEGAYGVGYSDEYGHVKLSDSINSDENIDYGVAATPYAVKQAYSKAVEAYNKAAALSGDSGIALTVSDMLDVMSYTLEKPGYDKISNLTIYLSEEVDIVSYEGKAFYIEISTVDLSEDESADTICNSDGGCPYTLYNKDGTQVNPLSGGTRAIIAISENKALVLMKEGE